MVAVSGALAILGLLGLAGVFLSTDTGSEYAGQLVEFSAEKIVDAANVVFDILISVFNSFVSNVIEPLIMNLGLESQYELFVTLFKIIIEISYFAATHLSLVIVLYQMLIISEVMRKKTMVGVIGALVKKETKFINSIMNVIMFVVTIVQRIMVEIFGLMSKILSMIFSPLSTLLLTK